MTLGLSPCPNDAYIFHALLHHLVPSPAHFTPHMADVEELNALARQKKLPVTKLSLGVVPYIMDDYAIMASGAALGWGCGPLVVAREDLPEEKWKTARVAVPGLMTTANLLLTLHGGFQGPREEMLFSDVMDAVLTGEADMGVIIHEGRFTYADRGLVKLLDDAENQKTANAIDFQMAASANELTPLLLQGELDILAVPANLGSVLYNKTQGGVKMLAVSTLGVLYMVEKGGETVTDIKSLAGKTIYATGKGATPEYALTYLLARNGLELGKDVNVEWKSEPTEIVAQMAAQDSAVAMLPQPFVVVAMGQVEGLRVALDLTEQWNALGGDSQLITAVLLVRSEFLDQHPQAVDQFMKEYAASAAFVNDQPAEAAVLVEKYGIVKAAVAEKAIPACNIVCLTGDDMKTAASGYLQVLFDQNPESVGGKLPGDDFYWMGN